MKYYYIIVWGKHCVQLKAEKDNPARRGENEGGNMVREVFSRETMPADTGGDEVPDQGESICKGKEE